MTIQRQIISFFNKILGFGNLHLDSLTLNKREVQRIESAARRGAFTKALYPIPASFGTSDHEKVLRALPSYQADLDNLKEKSRNQVDYQFANGFYTSPDAEVLYTIMRMLKPQRVLEIGCGNSTRITRQAIIDGGLSTKLTCIDPSPRRDVAAFADELNLCPVEESKAVEYLSNLEPGDVLFIDTSHIVLPANDCAYIYSVLIPLVPSGVHVHIHDIFLPYEYPEHFVRGNAPSWGEQYLVAMMLQGKDWETLWPGHYLQRTLPDFASHFPHLGSGLAQSLWIRRK